MQVHNVNNTVQPFSELFTLVVISHNRSAFLRRTLEYYRSFSGKVLVLDSSDNPDQQLTVQFPGVDYRHMGHLGYSGLQEKLAYGSSVVTTPFMAFAADDDFLLPGAISQSVEFLQANPDYGLCHGYCMMYVARATEVHYFRRDLKVQEDYNSEDAGRRVTEFLGQFLPPFYAVTRTALLRDWHQAQPEGMSFEWQEIGHAFYLLARAKARILDIAYIIREVNYGGSSHSTNVLTVLTYTTAKAIAEREQFADFLSGLPTGLGSLDGRQARQVALDSFDAMRDCLLEGRSLRGARIFRSQWIEPDDKPVRLFEPEQFVEMPFYNKRLFDQLTEIEMLLHAMPAGRQQLLDIEGDLVRQHELLRRYDNDTAQSVRARLQVAFNHGIFNTGIVEQLIQALENDPDPDGREFAERLQGWSKRLAAVRSADRADLLAKMPSGLLLDWLQVREPDASESRKANELIQQGGPRFEILLLDLNDDLSALQATFDSLMSCNLKLFKVVVLTAGAPPVTTSRRDTVHFIKVDADRYIEKLNEIAAKSSADWLLLAEAGVQFTGSGLLRAALELRNADGCRAVAMDEIHRRSDGVLQDVFRPGANLDLLLAVPDLMAGHWLVRKEVLLEVGGYSAEFPQALEFNTLLKIIEQGGMAGLAHLAEPLLICDVSEPEINEDQNRALLRHLKARGYDARVSSPQPGVLSVDYRHEQRPLVSIVLPSGDDFASVQACLVSVLQRTRYYRHEILIAVNEGCEPDMQEWLDQLQAKGDRVRVIHSSERVSRSALINLAAGQAKGEYLLFLSPEAQVVNANWLDSLVNQAQRPEVGIVSGTLADAQGRLTQAGLTIGFDQGATALSGCGQSSEGYMQRFAAEPDCTAVSSACMMVRKELFDSAGGFDSNVFAEHFYDVDLCLQLADAGYLTVVTPHAQIRHGGEVTRSDVELEALRSKWPVAMQQDKAYNANHRVSGKLFTLSAVEKVEWDQLTI